MGDVNSPRFREEEIFPEVISGHPYLPHSEWQNWEESFKTSYREYVENQYDKDMAVYAVRDAVGRLENILCHSLAKRQSITNQHSLFGNPMVYFAESYMTFFERLLRSLSQETRYGMEQMIPRRVISGRYLNISHLHLSYVHFCSHRKPALPACTIALNLLRFFRN